jgi:hypothetical protein
MGKSSPSTPAAPDPVATANAQGEMNKETAIANAQLNRVNQVTPYGNLTYAQTPQGGTFDQAGYDTAMADYQSKLAAYNATPNVSANGINVVKSNQYGADGEDFTNQQATPAKKGTAPTAPDRSAYTTGGNPNAWTSTVTLDPAQQKLLDSSNTLSQNYADLGIDKLQSLSSALQDPLSYSSAPQVQVGTTQKGIDEAMAKQLADASYKNATGYLDPQWQQSQAELESKLANQGVMQNSEAWNKAADDMGRQKEFAYSQARSGAVNEGFTQGLNSANLNNSGVLQDYNTSMGARTQAINELTALRANPLNEINALRTGSQVSTPTFNSTPQVSMASPDYIGATNANYQGQLNSYNAQTGSDNSFMSGLMGLGSAAITKKW